MKQFITLLLLFTTSLFYAQDLNTSGSIDAKPDIDTHGPADNKTYNSGAIQIQPEYPDGGIQGFFKYFNSKFKKDKIKDVHTAVKLFASFAVEKDGSITDVKILRSERQDINEQVIKILNASPKWKPAQQDGNPVRCTYTLPITIDFSDNKK